MFPLEQWKMEIANSAYVQIETLNFTFDRQAAIVYCYVCSNFQKSLCQKTYINVQADYFLSIILDYTLIASKNSMGPMAVYIQ